MTTPTDEDKAAQNYFDATGEWPAGYTPPGEETPEEKQKSAAKAYFDATGTWPGEKPADVKSEEAPEDGFSHYLHLASGAVKRFAVHSRRPTTFPTNWNGDAVVSVQNAIAPGGDGTDE